MDFYTENIKYFDLFVKPNYVQFLEILNQQDYTQ